MKILIVEDNKKIAEYTKDFLKKNNFIVDVINDGSLAVERVLNHSYDLIILDIMLPGKDGLEICQELRSKNYLSPIIMATALDQTSHTIRGLDSGADDYIIKPFELEELLARIKALLRRAPIIKNEIIEYKNLVLDKSARTLKLSGKNITLTTKEFDLLLYLLENRNIVLSRGQLTEHCWDFSSDNFSNVVDAHIKQLRKKLNDKKNEYIKTVRGIGYTISD